MKEEHILNQECLDRLFPGEKVVVLEPAKNFTESLLDFTENYLNKNHKNIDPKLCFLICFNALKNFLAIYFSETVHHKNSQDMLEFVDTCIAQQKEAMIAYFKVCEKCKL